MTGIKEERGGKTERFEMRLDVRLIERLDRWRERQGDGASRAEAVRRLVEKGLEGERRDLSISDGDKLLLTMLADIHKATVKEAKGETDPDFVVSALCGGHLWGLQWQHSALFHGHVDSPEVVTEVVDILEMWSQIEWSFGRLPRDAQDRVEAEAGYDRSMFRFLGFDGNEESEHFSVASFMIEKLGRFESFKDRELNSHLPVLNGYRRQHAAFAPIRARSRGERLQASDLIEILREG
jgi:uncharacterized protein YfbU (UPF0304 family)